MNHKNIWIILKNRNECSHSHIPTRLLSLGSFMRGIIVAGILLFVPTVATAAESKELSADFDVFAVTLIREQRRPEIGDKFPTVTYYAWEDRGEGRTLQTLSTASSEGKRIYEIVPGAFTPTCTNTHIKPIADEVAKKESALNTQGVEVFVIGRNDSDVMEAWLQSMRAPATLRAIPDPKYTLLKLLGAAQMHPNRLALIGGRSSIYVLNGIIVGYAFEEDNASCGRTGIKNALEFDWVKAQEKIKAKDKGTD
jgi:peroxiredoxin